MVMHFGLYAVLLTPPLSRLGEGVSLEKDRSSAASIRKSTASQEAVE